MRYTWLKSMKSTSSIYWNALDWRKGNKFLPCFCRAHPGVETAPAAAEDCRRFAQHISGLGGA